MRKKHEQAWNPKTNFQQGYKLEVDLEDGVPHHFLCSAPSLQIVHITFCNTVLPYYFSNTSCCRMLVQIRPETELNLEIGHALHVASLNGFHRGVKITSWTVVGF